MATPVSCEPNDLLAQSLCYKCIPTGMQPEVITFLLAQIAGYTGDTNALMSDARCFKCIPVGTQAEVQTYLLCQIMATFNMNAKLIDSGIAQLAGGTTTVITSAASATNTILKTLQKFSNGFIFLVA